MSKTDNEWRPKTVGEYRELAQCIASTFIIPQHLKEGTIEYWLTVTPFHIEQALYHLEFLIHTIRDKDLNILHGGSVTHRGNEQVCYYVQELFLLAWMALDANTGNAWIGGMFEDYDDLYNNHWPKNPQATAFTEAGLSAMEATFAFFDMFHHTVPYIRDISNSSVVEPKPCKAVQAMKEAVKLVLNRILPENEWPTSKIEREIKTLIVQINHELKQYQASTAPEPESLQSPVLSNLTLTQRRVLDAFIEAIQSLGIKPGLRGAIKAAHKWLCEKYPNDYWQDKTNYNLFAKHLRAAKKTDIQSSKDSLDFKDQSLMSHNITNNTD